MSVLKRDLYPEVIRILGPWDTYGVIDWAPSLRGAGLI